jgi:hypothetical protein
MSDHPSDYSFLKSGFNNLVEPSKPDEETLLTVSSMVTAFMDNALREADKYVQHANRNGITKEDIVLALKSETFKFLNRPDVNNNVQKWREILEEERDNEEDIEDEDDSDEYMEKEEVDEPINEFKVSECQCQLCQEINNIDNLWVNWSAQTPIEKILKKVIDTKF